MAPESVSFPVAKRHGGPARRGERGSGLADRNHNRSTRFGDERPTALDEGLVQESKSPKAERPGKAPAKGRNGTAKNTTDGGKPPPAEFTSSTAPEHKVKGQRVMITPTQTPGSSTTAARSGSACGSTGRVGHPQHAFLLLIRQWEQHSSSQSRAYP
jgi:hypothetical protein